MGFRDILFVFDCRQVSLFKGKSGKRAETPPFKAGSDNFTHSKVSESEPDMV